MKLTIFSLLVAIPGAVFGQAEVSSAVTSTYNLEAPSISGNGGTLAYYAAASNPYIAVVYGGTTYDASTGLTGVVSRPFVSRDGSAVVFYASPSSGSSIQPYIAEAPSWTPTEIPTTSTTFSADPTFNPPSVSDNQGTSGSPLHYVAYQGLEYVAPVKGKGGVVPQIYVWNESTGATVVASEQGTTTANSSCSFPAIDSAGTALAFVSAATNFSVGGTGTSTKVFYSVISSGTWGVTACPSLASTTSANWPSISSAGTTLVFQAMPTSGTTETYEWTTTGGSAFIPYSTSTPGIGGATPKNTFEPCISPDGQAILFSSDRNFTGANNVDTFDSPTFTHVGTEVMYFLYLSSGNFALESYDYRSTLSTGQVLLQADFGSITNQDSNGVYHGAFFGGETYIISTQNAYLDIFVF